MEKCDIDRSKLGVMFGEIRILEGENLRTGKHDDKIMAQKIAKIIQIYAKEE